MKTIRYLLFTSMFLLTLAQTSYAQPKQIRLLVTDKPSAVQENVESKVKIVLNDLELVNHTTTIERLTGAEYLAMQKLFKFGQKGYEKTRILKQAATITRRSEEVWLFDTTGLGGIEGIEIEYTENGDAAIQTGKFMLKGKQEGEQKRFLAEGLVEHRFSSDPAWTLKRGRFVLSNGPTEWFEFPQANKHFLVTISGPTDVNLDKFFDKLADKDVVGIPIQDSQRSQATFVSANFAEIDVISRDGFVGAKYNVSFRPLREVGKCKSVYFLFPLTPELKRKAEKELRDQKMWDVRSKPAEALNKSSFLGYNVIKNDAMDSGILSPDTEPAWYEVPISNAGEDGAEFVRSWTIKEGLLWQQKDFGPDGQPLGLYAYYFDSMPPQLLPVGQKNGDGEKIWQDFEASGWKSGIEKIAETTEAVSAESDE